MKKQPSNYSDNEARNLMPKVPRRKPKRGKPGLPLQKPTDPQSPKKSGTDDTQPRPRIPIWIDGQGEAEFEMPRGVPGGYHGHIVDLRYLDQDIGAKRRKFEVTMVVGDFNGHIGVGYGQAMTRQRAAKQAMKKAAAQTFKVARMQTTLAKPIISNSRGIHVAILPAEPGSGITAPQSVRALLELAGITDATVSLSGDLSDATALKVILRALGMPEQRAEIGTRRRSASSSYHAHRTGARNKSAITKQASPMRKRASK